MPDNEDFRDEMVKEALGLDSLETDLNDDLEEEEIETEPRTEAETKEPDKFKDISLKFGKDSEVKPDGKGNLVDGSGKVVAQAGAQARFYQEAHNARRAAQAAEGEISTLRGQLERAVAIARDLDAKYEALKAAGGIAEKAGLNEQEHLQAITLFSRLKSDPKGAIQQMLTQAAAGGTDLTQLGLTQSPVDVKSLHELIRGSIDQALNPLRERSERDERERAEREAYDRTVREEEGKVRQFFSRNPDAGKYAQAIHDTIQRFPEMTIGEAWARIQLNLLQRQQSSQSRPSGRRTPPLANGEDDEAMAPVTQSFDQIIKDVMAKHYTPRG